VLPYVLFFLMTKNLPAGRQGTKKSWPILYPFSFVEFPVGKNGYKSGDLFAPLRTLRRLRASAQGKRSELPLLLNAIFSAPETGSKNGQMTMNYQLICHI